MDRLQKARVDLAASFGREATLAFFGSCIQAAAIDLQMPDGRPHENVVAEYGSEIFVAAAERWLAVSKPKDDGKVQEPLLADT